MAERGPGMECVGDTFAILCRGRSFDSRERPRGGRLAILIFLRALFWIM